MPMILVTGATGFLGSHVAEALLARGDRVRLLVRRPAAARWLADRGAECVAGDLGATDTLAEAVRGCRAVIHCAALAADWGSWEDFQAANIIGVANLLAACSGTSLDRFVHVSTVDVYGYPDRDGLDESTPYRDRGFPYNTTKIAGEKAVWAAIAAGLPGVILRPGSIYGPRSMSFGVELVEVIRAGAPLIRGGDVNAGLAYVANVVDLMLLALEHPAALGQVFHSLDDDGHTWRDYLAALCGGLALAMPTRSLPHGVAYALGASMEWLARIRRQTHRPLLTRSAVEMLGTCQGFTMTRAREQLGFAPLVGFEEGVERTIAWLRSRGGSDRQ